MVRGTFDSMTQPHNGQLILGVVTHSRPKLGLGSMVTQFSSVQFKMA